MAHFGSIFPILEAKIFFLENPALSCTTSYGFLTPCQNFEKVNDTIQKCPDRWKDGLKDGQQDRQTLFYRTLPAIAGGGLIKKFIGHKNIINTYRKQGYNSVICGYFCIGFTDFMLWGKSQLDFTNSFSPIEYKSNNKIILKYFQ